jgi:hypothetical protein
MSGLTPVLLGSEIESVSQYPKLKHYGDYRIPSPATASMDDHIRARPFTESIRNIAAYAGVSITVTRFRDKPSVNIKNVTLLFIQSRSLYTIPGDENYKMPTRNFRDKYGHLSIGYAQKWLYSRIIVNMNIHDVEVDRNEVAISLFASSNTRNDRDDWKKLTRNNHIISLPYRREYDSDIWEDKYSDYTYTVEELPEFSPVDKFVQYSLVGDFNPMYLRRHLLFGAGIETRSIDVIKSLFEESITLVDGARPEHISLFNIPNSPDGSLLPRLGIHAAEGEFDGKAFNNTLIPEFIERSGDWVLVVQSERLHNIHIKSLGKRNFRRSVISGNNYQTEPNTRWVVISNLINFKDIQVPPFNSTEFAKVMTVNLRERLGHTNDTLHAIRRIVRFNLGLHDNAEIAGHLINMLLATHYRPVNIKQYFRMIHRNLLGIYPYATDTFEPNSKTVIWHSREEWIGALLVYKLMATSFGWKPKTFDLAWL